jgi:fumarylpyruvate hydrolase
VKPVFSIPQTPFIRVTGKDYIYPVRRIFCVGRNYVEHALELGNEVDRKQPFYFTKSSSSLLGPEADLIYPTMTDSLHHEVELVVAIGKSVHNANKCDLENSIYGYACGLDMTRRDLQNVAKKQGKPWDMAKDFDGSAIVGSITESEQVPAIQSANLKLFLNDQLQQIGKISDMIYSVDEILLDLSKYTKLVPGDLIMTGTPAGVSPVKVGDRLIVQIEGLKDLTLKVLEK